MHEIKKLITETEVFFQNISYETFAFYDYETDGITYTSQVTQFAGVKTNSKFEIMPDETVDIFVKPRLDTVPTIGAYMVTMIDINEQEEKGFCEMEASQKVNHFFTSNDKTAICGYNTIKFDDEFTRNLMYRNQRDVYGHEWRNGNGRVDFYQLTKFAFAYLPACINFPKIDGKTTLRLEHLSTANGIIHENAHEALSDVYATVEIAKKIRESSPPLFDYFINLSKKNNAINLLNSGTALFYTDTLFGIENHLTTVVVPIFTDELNSNKYICLDLRHDPEVILQHSKEDLKKYLFTKREDLPEGAPKVPAVSIVANKQPLIRAIGGNYVSQLLNRFNLNRQELEARLEILNKNQAEIKEKLSFIFSGYENNMEIDAYGTIYDGFFQSRDNNVRDDCWIMSKDGKSLGIKNIDVYAQANKSDNPDKIATLMLRAKWNNHYKEIIMNGGYSTIEMNNWLKDLRIRVSTKSADGKNYTITEFKDELKAKMMTSNVTEEQKTILGKLDKHVDAMISEMKMLGDVNAENINKRKVEMSSSPSYKEFKIRENKEKEYNSPVI